MTVYVARFQGAPLGAAQVTSGGPVANQSALVATGSVTASLPTEIWLIWTDAAHSLTWDTYTIALPSGYVGTHGVTKGSSITVAS